MGFFIRFIVVFGIIYIFLDKRERKKKQELHDKYVSRKGKSRKSDKFQNTKGETTEDSFSKSKNSFEIMLEDLRKKYTVTNYRGVLEEISNRASNQLVRVKDKYEKFKIILDNKLSKSELTYSKFLATTEQAYYSILDKLDEINEKLAAVENIEFNYIDERIQTIKSSEYLNKETLKELSSLRTRKNMAKEEIKKMNDILSINEDLITKIDEIRVRLANINTGQTKSDMNLNYNRKELEKLIERTSVYSKD